MKYESSCTFYRKHELKLNPLVTPLSARALSRAKETGRCQSCAVEQAHEREFSLFKYCIAGVGVGFIVGITGIYLTMGVLGWLALALLLASVVFGFLLLVGDGFFPGFRSKLEQESLAESLRKDKLAHLYAKVEASPELLRQASTSVQEYYELKEGGRAHWLQLTPEEKSKVTAEVARRKEALLMLGTVGEEKQKLEAFQEELSRNGVLAKTIYASEAVSYPELTAGEQPRNEFVIYPFQERETEDLLDPTRAPRS